MRSRGAMRGNHVDLAKPAVMQQHATRETSIPNSAAATSTAPKCAASQPAMKCGPASLRSHQSSAKRPACSSVSQPLAISERNSVFVIKHRVEGERHKGSLQRCNGQLSSQSGSKEQQAPSPPPPLPSTPLSFPMPLHPPPPPHLLPSHPPPPPLPHPYPGQEEQGGVTVTRPPLAHPTPTLSHPTPPHPTPANGEWPA
ncbi:hypothetical protein QJQ45_027242 [Haematococcus lacustris]|nr:hypothetical protein QJQ45_027242 [Haematococcus lacustris]